LDRQAGLEALGYSPFTDEGGEITFFCVPEWHLEATLDSTISNGLWIIRSTTRPGDVKAFQESHGRHVLHLPEFLREATALADALEPDRMVIGECCTEHGDLVANLFSPLMCPILRVDSSTSEMIKLVSNAHLSTLISFWNEIHQICEIAQVNSTIVGRAVSMDNRISAYGAMMHGKPFGGFCLPKDLNSLIKSAQLGSVQPSVLEAVRDVNVRLSDGATNHTPGHQTVQI
jgi:UDPglucose 6-dehydrogenase